MKKIAAILMALVLMTCCVTALASTDARVIESRISTRSGPGTKYSETGSFLSYGAELTAHTKVWDSRNEMYWVQVEFTSGNEAYRVYTGDWRLDVDLRYVPEERVLEYTWIKYSTYGYAGPGYEYHYYSDIQLNMYGNCAIIEVENNFALIETLDSSVDLTRVWVPLEVLGSGANYRNQDTYTGHNSTLNGGSGSQTDDGPVLLPDGATTGRTDYVDPVGQYVTVYVESANVRSGPGTNYSDVGNVHEGDVLEVLDRTMGNTGKDWYMVRVDGNLCWLSSATVRFFENYAGTSFGVPIYVEPVGQVVTVYVESANVRSGPGVHYSDVGNVQQGETLEVLARELGDTNKDWYMVRVNGELCWLSSGVVSLYGNYEGTVYGVPIVMEDPLADYPQADTHLIGRWFSVKSVRANVRKVPNTESEAVGYALQNECYEILDSRIGSTGKVWYMIQIDGAYGWISSGIVSLLP